MNYLAHAYLAGESDESLLGNLMGDFVKGRIEGYPAEIARGIAAHRRIDTFTDSHPIVRESKRLISQERRRFAGIMLDLFYDHLLARYWHEYSVTSLDAFSARVYGILRANDAILPHPLRSMAPYMTRQDWLGSYRELKSIGGAIDGISSRLTRANSLRGGVEELAREYDALHEQFRRFFPELREFARTL